MYNKALDVFLEVADCGSFSRAASKLFISHTAVIKQINNLEDDLETTLFFRTPQGITLTPAGKALYNEAPKIIDLSYGAVHRIQQASRMETDTLILGCSALYPAGLFSDFWKKLNNKYPRFHFKTIAIRCDSLRFEELSEYYDFMIGPCEPSDSAQCEFIPMGESNICLLMPFSHPLAEKESLSLQDLEGYRLMLVRAGESEVTDIIREDIIEYYPKVQMIDINPSYSNTTFNRCEETGDLLLSLDLWAGYHPMLKAVPLREQYTVPYGIILSPDQSPAIRAFSDLLHELAGQKKWL